MSVKLCRKLPVPGVRTPEGPLGADPGGDVSRAAVQLEVIKIHPILVAVKPAGFSFGAILEL